MSHKISLFLKIINEFWGQVDRFDVQFNDFGSIDKWLDQSATHIDDTVWLDQSATHIDDTVLFLFVDLDALQKAVRSDILLFHTSF